jgi:5'/3'-nucleotidase SurE
MRTLLLVITGISLALSACATAANPVESTSLRILLTNDDGVDAPGIKTLRAVLLEAGHDVTVVAPAGNQSGEGAKVTSSGTLNYEQRSPGVWSIEGTPADAVLVGLIHVMRDQAPDLVVSGANFGQNPGYAINSGTVGAATVSMYAGTPAIAISVGVDYAELNTKPYPFPSTIRAFAGAADLTVQLIADLQQELTGDGGLLPSHTILNVNYPALVPEEIRGVRVVPAARSAGVSIDYNETDESGKLSIEIQAADMGAPDADLQLFSQGYVTITIFDGDWDAGAALRDDIAQRLSSLEQ